VKLRDNLQVLPNLGAYFYNLHNEPRHNRKNPLEIGTLDLVRGKIVRALHAAHHFYYVLGQFDPLSDCRIFLKENVHVHLNEGRSDRPAEATNHFVKVVQGVDSSTKIASFN